MCIIFFFLYCAKSPQIYHPLTSVMSLKAKISITINNSMRLAIGALANNSITYNSISQPFHKNVNKCQKYFGIALKRKIERKAISM